jgi:glycosyltransferase involved in cell wall biosynthesis
MPHVVLLCEYPTLNGGERSMLATLDGVDRAGFRVTAVAPPDGPLAGALRFKGIDLVPLGDLDSQSNRPSQAERREELAAIVAHLHPDLVHANSVSMGRLSGPVVAAAGARSIAHLRDIIKLSGQATADLNRHTRILAVSEATRAAHVACGLDPAKAFALHNGVDLEQFHPRPATGWLHRELGLPHQARLVATIGQIGLRKAQDVLAQAAALVAAEQPDVHWLILGERSSEKAESLRFEANLKEAATGVLAGRFHLLGRRNDVDRVLDEITLLVHPARQEPLGRILLEAAAAGLAVIATDVGGTREIFPAESDAAWLIAPNDPKALAEATGELLRDEPRRCQMAAAARRRAEEAFSIDRAVAGLVGHYREVLEC